MRRYIALGSVPELVHDAKVLQRALQRGDVAASTLRSGSVHARAELIAKLGPRVMLSDEAVSIASNRRDWLMDAQLNSEHDPIELACPATKVQARAPA